MTPAFPFPDGVVAGAPDAASASHADRREAVVAGLHPALDAYTCAVAHDLRAPLRAIDGYALALLEDCAGQVPPGVLDLLGRIRQATATMEQRVDGLVALSRLGRADLRKVPCDLAPTIAQSLDSLQRAEPRRDVTTLIPTALWVLGDAALLGIALENLLANAWKFTRASDAARIEIGVHDAESETVIAIRDNGTGFDMRQAHRLGLPFQRLHAADTYEGTGLGLASTRRIVERHGGRMWAHGVPGEGATFYLSLPSVPIR